MALRVESALEIAHVADGGLEEVRQVKREVGHTHIVLCREDGVSESS